MPAAQHSAVVGQESPVTNAAGKPDAAARTRTCLRRSKRGSDSGPVVTEEAGHAIGRIGARDLPQWAEARRDARRPQVAPSSEL